jgi:zinc protease
MRPGTRRIIAAFLAMVLLGATPASAPTAQVSTSGTRIQTQTLPNGLKVVVVEDHAVSVVESQIWYRFGALDETPGKTGLAHGLEHMMFRGTPSVSGSGLDDISARLGAGVNASTSNESTDFYFVLPADKLGLALRLEADRMTNLSLSEADWKLEKGAVLSELDGDLGQPLEKLYDRVCRAASTTRICSLGALGERADVARSHASDLRAYYREYYAPNNATLVITGDVEPAAAFALAGRTFARVPSRTLPSHPKTAPVYAHGKHVSLQADYPYELIDLAFAAPGSLDDGSPALQLIDSVITNQRSAFYKNVVLSGLTLGMSTSLDQNVHAGIYHVFLTVAPGHSASKAQDAFLRTLRSANANGFATELIDAGKLAVARQAIYATDSISGLADRVGYALAVEGLDDPAQDDAKVAAATPADVAAAARRFLSEPIVTGDLRPPSTKPGAPQASTSGGVADDFSKRAPAGKIVQAQWVRAALAAPSALHSKIAPVEFTLPNGLKVLIQEIHTNPTIFINGTIATSQRFDPPGKDGAGAMLSTLLEYGSRAYDFTAQRRVSDELAASIDLGFSFDAHGMASDAPKLFELIADALRRPTLPAKYVTLIRNQTLASISRRLSDPDYVATHAFANLMFAPSDPALREPSTASVKAIAQADLQRYAATYMRPDLTTISVVGDVDPNTVRGQLEAAFGGWRVTGHTPNVAAAALPAAHAARRFVLASDRAETDVHLGQPALARHDPDFYALNLLNQILGANGDFDTRLAIEIRVKRGLVYNVSSSLDVDKWRGTLNFKLGAAPADVAPAVAVLKQQLVRLQRERVGASELARAKTKLVAAALVDEQGTDVIASRVLRLGLNDLPANYYTAFARRYAALGPADIARVAKKYLRPDRLVEVYEGPRP